LNNTENPYCPAFVEMLGESHRVVTIGEFKVCVVVIHPHLER
jgi:hypothetical protein